MMRLCVALLLFCGGTNAATLRYWITNKLLNDERRGMMEGKRKLGYAALEVMERHLEERRYFVAERYSVADIALYAYTHVADEGGFDLEPYPAIGSWLARVAAQPGHVPITD